MQIFSDLRFAQKILRARAMRAREKTRVRDFLFEKLRKVKNQNFIINCFSELNWERRNSLHLHFFCFNPLFLFQLFYFFAPYCHSFPLWHFYWHLYKGRFLRILLWCFNNYRIWRSVGRCFSKTPEKKWLFFVLFNISDT